MIGTTDLDHTLKEDETRMTRAELDYLLEAAQHTFKDFPVTEEDIISTFSGLRPVINTDAPTPSKESRAHKIWEEDGLVTIAGGKLSIFRVMAADVLNYCHEKLPGEPKFDHRTPCFIHPKPKNRQDAKKPDWIMMAGRLGEDVNSFFTDSNSEHLVPIDPLPQFWAELAWAAQHEAVVHLDDLLLRRVRMGLLLPKGGLNFSEQIRHLIQEPLGWSEDKWQEEVERYEMIWQKYYHIPD